MSPPPMDTGTPRDRRCNTAAASASALQAWWIATERRVGRRATFTTAGSTLSADCPASRSSAARSSAGARRSPGRSSPAGPTGPAAGGSTWTPACAPAQPGSCEGMDHHEKHDEGPSADLHTFGGIPGDHFKGPPTRRTRGTDRLPQG
jgi:hypothetical protein